MSETIISPSQLEITQRIRQCLLDSLPEPSDYTSPFLSNYANLVREYPLREGKTWRGLLTCLTTLIHDGRLEDVLPIAAALELFQNWIIVHDDVEDESDERRGKPTLHILANAPMAVNVGDGMHAYMWNSLFRARSSQDVLNEFVELIKTTVEGQHIELPWIAHNKFDLTEDEYFGMAERKGGYYTMVAPLRLGALSAGVTPPSNYYQIGLELGVAYQLRDDVLNLIGDQRTYGKEIAGDLWEGKRTIIILHFLSNAEQETKTKANLILKKPRRKKTQEEVSWLLEAVLDSPSIKYTQMLAEQKVSHSISLLHEVWNHSINEQAKEMAFTIIEEIATRVS